MGITATTADKTALSVKEILSKVIIIIVGLAFIFSGIILNKLVSTGTYQQTEAVITKTEYMPGAQECYVYVDYTAAGRSYHKIRLYSYVIGWKEGKTIKIEYNIDDPEDIQAPFTAYIPYGNMAFGAILAGSGVYCIIRTIRWAVRSSAADD